MPYMCEMVTTRGHTPRGKSVNSYPEVVRVKSNGVWVVSGIYDCACVGLEYWRSMSTPDTEAICVNDCRDG